MKLKVFAVIASILLLVCLCACSGNGSGGSDKPIAAVSIVPQYTFAKAVAGDLWEITTVIPPGSSPESYEPTPNERMMLEKAKVYFSVGVPAEDASILPVIGSNTKVIALEDMVSAVYEDVEISGGRDPHIWLSPKRVKVMIEAMADEFSALDPQNSSIYEQNAQNYIKQLDELDEYITSALEEVKNRKFIVFHPAFGYIAADYGLQMIALEEEGREATPKHLQEMAELAKNEGIKTVFYQAEVDGRQAEAFAEAIGGKTVMLEPLSADYIENLKGMADLMAETMK